jgi:protein TonB
VVGLSLDNTVEGGSGPSFATGNTRRGRTADRAADPRAVPPRAGPAAAEPKNQAASRIPTGSAKYVPPRRARPVQPHYPATLKAQGIEADVTVLVKLDAKGAVTAVDIIKSGGHPEFDEAARRAAEREAFHPATRDGTAIPYTLSYTYRFRLEEK